MNDQDNNIINADEDVMLPEGWDGKSDIFSQPSGQTESKAPEPADQAPTTGTEAAAPTTGGADGAAPPTTTGQAAETGAQEAQALTTGSTQGAPDVAPEAKAAGKIRFTASVDHTPREVEITEADLPGIYQRAQVTERVQQRLQQLQPKLDRAEQLARELGYKDLEGMVAEAGDRYRKSQVEAMVADGTPKAMAEFIVSQRSKETAAAAPPPTAPTTGTESQGGAAARDFQRELSELKAAFPDAGQGGRLPDEVVAAAVKDCQQCGRRGDRADRHARLDPQERKRVLHPVRTVDGRGYRL